jgi:hypothetical protein
MSDLRRTTTIKKPLFKRVTPLGWLFIGFFAVIAVSLVVLAIRPLTYPIRSLPTGIEAKSTAPTITPYLKPTDVAAPTSTPLPGGWTQGKSLNGTPCSYRRRKSRRKLRWLFSLFGIVISATKR